MDVHKIKSKKITYTRDKLDKRCNQKYPATNWLTVSPCFCGTQGKKDITDAASAGKKIKKEHAPGCMAVALHVYPHKHAHASHQYFDAPENRHIYKKHTFDKNTIRNNA